MRFKEALELIDKYDLEEFYAHNSDSVTGEHFNISSYYVLPKLLSHYGIKRHSHKENITLTCLSRYGVPHSHTP